MTLTSVLQRLPKTVCHGACLREKIAEHRRGSAIAQKLKIGREIFLGRTFLIEKNRHILVAGIREATATERHTKYLWINFDACPVS